MNNLRCRIIGLNNMANPRLKHKWDHDACCIHCGFDGAESHHLIKLGCQDKTDDDIYCPHGTIENKNWADPIEECDSFYMSDSEYYHDE